MQARDEYQGQPTIRCNILQHYCMDVQAVISPCGDVMLRVVELLSSADTVGGGGAQAQGLHTSTVVLSIENNFATDLNMH